MNSLVANSSNSHSKKTNKKQQQQQHVDRPDEFAFYSPVPSPYPFDQAPNYMQYTSPPNSHHPTFYQPQHFIYPASSYDPVASFSAVPPPYHPAPQFSGLEPYPIMENTTASFYTTPPPPPPSPSTSQNHQAWVCLQLKGQVEFYFSFENLVRDDYMVQQLLMHGENSIPCTLVGSFPRVREILGGSTASPLLLQEALLSSPIVRVYGNVLVPLTDALHQALHVRRMPTSLQQQPSQRQEHSLHDPKADMAAAARYSPATTSVTDDTTASSQATTPKETPPVTLQTPEEPLPAEHPTPLHHSSAPMVRAITPVQPQAHHPGNLGPWPVESPQSQFAYVYNTHQVVPYGYTVTTAPVTPSDCTGELVRNAMHNHPTDNASQYPQQPRRNNNNKKRNQYNRFKKKSRPESRQSKPIGETNPTTGDITAGLSADHQVAREEDPKQQPGDAEKLSGVESPPTNEEKLSVDSDGNVQDTTNGSKHQNHNNNNNNQNKKQQQRYNQNKNSHKNYQARKSRNNQGGKTPTRGGGGGGAKSTAASPSSSTTSWTKDDFPSLNPQTTETDEATRAALQRLSLDL